MICAQFPFARSHAASALLEYFHMIYFFLIDVSRPRPMAAPARAGDAARARLHTRLMIEIARFLLTDTITGCYHHHTPEASLQLQETFEFPPRILGMIARSYHYADAHSHASIAACQLQFRHFLSSRRALCIYAITHSLTLHIDSRRHLY